jgi:hypothetical protein
LVSEDDEIPLLARELIQKRIHSIEALEVVLALHEQAGQAVPKQELCTKLRISSASADSALAELCSGGLVECHGAEAHYRPATAELAEAVDALVVSYAQKRVEMLVLISKNAIGRVRNGALRTFAEAFRVRGRKDDG